MLAIDKLKRDLDEWQRHNEAASQSRQFDALRTIFLRAMGRVPAGTLNAVFTTFLSLYSGQGKRSGRAAMDWLGGVGSLLLMDYDGTAFSREEWAEIRDLVTQDSGDIDIDLLTYVLGQVMDHGAI